MMPSSPNHSAAGGSQNGAARSKQPPAARPPVARPTNNQRGGGGGRGGRPYRPSNRDEEQAIHRAASVFGSTRQWVQPFYDYVDPINPGNRVSGFLCKQEGAHKGSLLLTSINGQQLPEPQLVYGTPRMLYPYNKAEATTGDDGDDTITFDVSCEYDTFPSCHSFYLATKWNGVNVVFFTYRDFTNHMYVSATTRGRVFFDDSVFGNIRSAVYRIIARWFDKTEQEMSFPFPLAPALAATNAEDKTQDEGEPPAKGKSASSPPGRQSRSSVKVIDISALPPALSLLQDPDNVQSISFELCGSEEPHLVAYPFALDLKPLFFTSPAGVISPIIPARPFLPPLVRDLLQPATTGAAAPSATGEADAKADAADAALQFTERRLPFNDSQDLQRVCRDLQQWGEHQNRTWRKLKNLTQALFFHHFIIEGWVLYLLNERGEAVARSKLYKIKAKDIEGSHYEKFDLGVQKMVLLGLQKCYQAGKPITPANLRAELEWSEKAWKRFEREIYPFIDGRPNPEELLKEQEEERKRNPSGSLQRMVVMMGVPGSGKSTLAKRLIEAYPEFVRVNQDEMKTRKRCEAEAEIGLRRGKSVLVDRCNFDYQQRVTWIKLARKYGVKSIELVWLKVSMEVCKQRVSVRTDHPTIAPGEQGLAIIDRFKSLLADPLTAEGFTAVHVLENDQDTLRLFPALGFLHPDAAAGSSGSGCGAQPEPAAEPQPLAEPEPQAQE